MPRQRRSICPFEQVLPPTPGEARKKALHIPLRIGLLAPDGRDMDLKLSTGERITDGLLHVTKRSQKFRFTGIDTKPVISLLRGFSAPVNLTIDRTDDELAFLIAHDSDLFARWQAGVDFATRIMVGFADDPKDLATMKRADAFAQGLSQTLANDTLSPAYLAEVIKVPSEADIARAIGNNVDPLPYTKHAKFSPSASPSHLEASLKLFTKHTPAKMLPSVRMQPLPVGGRCVMAR